MQGAGFFKHTFKHDLYRNVHEELAVLEAYESCILIRRGSTSKVSIQQRKAVAKVPSGHKGQASQPQMDGRFGQGASKGTSQLVRSTRTRQNCLPAPYLASRLDAARLRLLVV